MFLLCKHVRLTCSQLTDDDNDTFSHRGGEPCSHNPHPRDRKVAFTMVASAVVVAYPHWCFLS